MNFLLATLIGLSFSVRTPNDDTKPLDYEISVKSAKERGNFQYRIKRDWERELGKKYTDTELKVTQDIGTDKMGRFYLGVKYVDKESKSFKYEQARIGAVLPLLNFGLAMTTETTMMNLTFKKIFKDETFEYKLYIDYSSDLEQEIWDIKGELRKYLNKNVHVYALFNREYLGGSKLLSKDYLQSRIDEQYKVGIGYKF